MSKFTKFAANDTCGRGLLLLWQQCHTFCG